MILVAKKQNKCPGSLVPLLGFISRFKGVPFQQEQLFVSSIIKLCILCASTLFLVVVETTAAERYEFTDLSDRKLVARILDCNAREVKVERIADKRIFEIPLDDLCEQDRAYLHKNYLQNAGAEKSQLVPGETVLLDFPELGEMARGKLAQCELSVPKHYDPSKPVPLFVWFSGGKGSHKINGAKGLVDYDRFLVLAIPYPHGRLPRLAVNQGENAINAFWKFQQPMLERVIEMVPNISADVRIAAGSSSGGHLVGSALDQKWKGFCDYFTGFVLHEGGHCPDMTFSGTQSSHRILVTYGENSEVRGWQKYFMGRFGQARGQIDYVEVPKAGHGLNGDGRRLIREWIEETFSEDLI